MPLDSVPQLNRPFLTDAGLETDMLFNRAFDLPHFASITLLRSEAGRSALTAYFEGFLDLARETGTGFILESATWRASPDWAEPLGLTVAQLDKLNRDAIDLLHQLRGKWRSEALPVVISGCIGPRGDGYDPGTLMSESDAQAYHSHQAGVLDSAGVDMLTAITMTNLPEAIGVARAAKELDCPVAISFTVEVDGTLPSGDHLSDAVSAVDAATASYPAYYMINCAHPTHFAGALDAGSEWAGRIRGLRANASRQSHAELDAMSELDKGDSAELAELHGELVAQFPRITVLGGCCGTDLEHVRAIAERCFR